MSNSPRSPLSVESSEPEEDHYVPGTESEEEAPSSPAEAHSAAAPRSPSPATPGESGSSSEPVPTLASLAAELKRTRLSVSYLNNEVARLNRSLGAVTDRNRELTDEVLSHRARLAKLTPAPPGSSNQELSDRVDHLGHLYHNLRENVDHDIAHLVVDLTTLQMRVDIMDEQAQEAQMAAMVNPPPEDDGEEDAQSDVSDASDPMEP